MTGAVLASAIAAIVPAHPCQTALPHGPAVPAPIVMWTSCGGFRLGTDGTVTRLPAHWLADHGGGTGRRWGASLNIRRNHAGRYVLRRGDRLVWRSRGLYPNDGGSVGLGPGEFAFASYGRGVFLATLPGRERLVVSGRGLYPFAFTRQGDLIVPRRHSLLLVSRDGVIVRRFRLRPAGGFAFDVQSDSLYFVAPDGRLG